MEIERLHEMLTEAGIAHEWIDRATYLAPHPKSRRLGIDNINWGWQIVVYKDNGDRLVSAIEGWGTYGYGGLYHGMDGSDETVSDYIEIMGLLTPEEAEHDSVVGWLTAEQVFQRIKEALCGSK